MDTPELSQYQLDVELLSPANSCCCFGCLGKASRANLLKKSVWLVHLNRWQGFTYRTLWYWGCTHIKPTLLTSHRKRWTSTRACEIICAIQRYNTCWWETAECGLFEVSKSCLYSSKFIKQPGIYCIGTVDRKPSPVEGISSTRQACETKIASLKELGS